MDFLYGFKLALRGYGKVRAKFTQLLRSDSVTMPASRPHHASHLEEFDSGILPI
jgi:hypothetical protein